MESVPLQEYICNLDPCSLPRVVKICSGVYFQGSVYEILGSECCLSTGDLIKIVNIQLHKVSCKNTETGCMVELPLTFEGLFQSTPEQPRGTQKWHLLPGTVFRRNSSVCERQQYTLQEILHSPVLQRKTLKCPDIGGSAYLLSPEYKVEAIMHLRNNVVKFDSTLDVEVVDITEEAQHIHFIKPLMLSQVLQMDNVLPVRAEVLGASENTPVFQNKWVSRLQQGCRIQIHGKGSLWKILASSRKGRKCASWFLISGGYEGHFRRCPREFHSAAELARGLGAAKRLHVVVTRDYNGEDGTLPLFSVGDRLEVLGLMRAGDPSATDVLQCSRDNGDGDTERIEVPLFVDAGFVEDVRDSRKYTLREVVEHFQLPCEVKVVANNQAPSPLSCVSMLTLEDKITETFLTVSLEGEPSVTFEIPPRWLDLSLFFTGGLAQPTPPSRSPMVEQLTEAFYYSLLRQLPSNRAAPPRPPKRRDLEKNKCSERNSREEERKASAPTMMPCEVGLKDRDWPKVTQQASCGGVGNRTWCSQLSSKVSMDTFLETAKLPHPRTWQARTELGPLTNQNEYRMEYRPSRPPKTAKPFKQAIDTSSREDSDHDYEDIHEPLEAMVQKMHEAAIKH